MQKLGVHNFGKTGIYVSVVSNVHLNGKAVPLQARWGSEGSRKLRFPDFVTKAQDGGRYEKAAFTPRKCSWYSFLLEAESIPGP